MKRIPEDVVGMYVGNFEDYMWRERDGWGRGFRDVKTRVQFDARVPTGVVITADPAPGVEVPADTPKLTVIVSGGKSPKPASQGSRRDLDMRCDCSPQGDSRATYGS